MDSQKIKQLQDLQLHMMKIIHNICVTNNIDYYIIGGTALGSIRHHGFIPWDIDIDIAMTRPNYIKFKECATRLLPAQMAYKDHTSEPDFRPPHAIVEWSNSYIIDSKDRHKHKIFIDIFPLDIAPANKKLQEKQAKQIKRIKFLKSCKLLSKSKKLNTTFLRRLFFYSFRIVAPLIDIPKINIRMQEIMQQYDSESAPTYICSMASHYSYQKQCMPITVYGKPTLMPFCDTEFYGPEQLDDYLFRIYGDYMKLPSKEAQEKYMNVFYDAGWNE